MALKPAGDLSLHVSFGHAHREVLHLLLLHLWLYPNGSSTYAAAYIAVLLLPSTNGCRRIIDSARAVALSKGVGK